jgi:RNA polymerase sigma factor (sigma-70 family)
LVERLYEGHRAEVYRTALRALGNADDAEDVTQAAFVDAYSAILRGSRPSAPRAWLLAIAENVRRRRFRTALRRPREEPFGAEIASGELAHEQADAVRRALATLPPQQREVLLLREVSGLSYDEIAARSGSTVASVQMLLFRARRALREELDPPAVTQRRALGLQLPAWVAHLAGRGETLALSPRGAGAAGAALLAVTGITAGGPHVQRDEPRAAVSALEQPRTQPPPASPGAPVPRSPKVVLASTRLVAASAKRKRAPVGPAPQETGAPQDPALTPPSPAPAAATELAAAPPMATSLPERVLPRTPVVAPKVPSAVAPPTPALPPVVPVPPVVLPAPPVTPPVPPVVLPDLPDLPELPEPPPLLELPDPELPGL